MRKITRHCDICNVLMEESESKVGRAKKPKICISIDKDKVLELSCMLRVKKSDISGDICQSCLKMVLINYKGEQ